MSISRLSRYYDGPILQVVSAVTVSPDISVYRNWPTKFTASYVEYPWEDGDTLGNLAQNSGAIKNSAYWWEIMDLNPEITDPWDIVPGTIIRIPNG
jgi:hypothetical protein